MPSLTKHPDHIWCDVHGDIHEPVTNPDDGFPNEHDKDGKPIWLERVEVYADDESDVFYGCAWEGRNRVITTVIRPMAPECTSEDWRLLWVGKRVSLAPVLESKNFMVQSRARER